MNEWFLLAAIGGLCIGAAAVIMLAALGRITGISGLLAQVVQQPLQVASHDWRLLFLVGLIIGPLIAHHLVGIAIPAPTNNPALALAGGLLVGFGTRLGSGCTSGHGICGISRLSTRSIAATLTFMSAGIITVFVIQQLGLRS